MTKTRIFVSWRKEEAWLTGMGKRGYKLTEIDAFDYKFVRHEGAVYEYSLEWLDVSPESDTGEEYLSSLSAGGWELCAAKRGWAYLVRRTDSESVPGEPVHTDAAVRRTAKHYRGVALFCLILFLVFVGISAYNFRCVAFFDAEEYTVPAISTDSDFLSGVFNNLIAGKNPALALLVLLLPIDAVLLLLCALFGGEFFATRSFLKRVRSDPALIGIIDNPQTAGGKADGTSASPSGTDGPGGSAE